MNLLLNGKFLGRIPTGVDRYALEISARVFDKLPRGSEPPTIALPHHAKLNTEAAGRFGRAHFSRSAVRVGAIIWEQAILPFLDRKKLLLSLCNIGPVLRRNQCVMIADGQFLTQAHAYSWAFRTWYRFALPLLARRARYLLTISEFSKSELEALGVFPKGKAQVVPCGIDHVQSIIPDSSILTRLAIEDQGYMLMIGSRARHKNVVPLLQALRGHLPEGARIVVAGGGNSKVFADDGLAASDEIIIAGRVTDEELVALYRGARAFLFPSLTEGFGLPPAEAMVLGCPVIASDRGAIPEVMGDACLYADPLDWKAWVTAIDRLWNDADLRHQLVRKGDVQAQKWTWDRAADRLMAVLENRNLDDEE